MNEQNYVKHIQNQIIEWSESEPILTSVVAVNLTNIFGMKIDDAKKITNVNLKRLADKGNLIRIQKGVYSKVKETPFGKLAPMPAEVISSLLLRNGESTIGYIAGPTLLNALGLCNLVPRERHIVTNHYRHQIPLGVLIRVYKPMVTVNDENAPYLRIIEALMAMDKYPIDAENPDKILRVALLKNKIDSAKLIMYARKYYGQKVLLKTIDIALGGVAV